MSASLTTTIRCARACLSTWGLSNVGLFALCLPMLIISGMTGCGPGDPVPTAYVSGTVTLDGAPLADAEINFLGTGYAGIAKTDAKGAFSMKAEVGKNTVYFSKYEGEVDPTMTMGMEGKSAKYLPKQLVPKKYTTDKSELKHDVPAGGQKGIEFKLSK
jgi:hypothetical protein